MNKGGDFMTYDYSKLSGKIVEKYGTQYKFATAMGFSDRTMSLKLNNRVGWKNYEIEQAIDLLGLSVEDIPEYFFRKEVHVS